MRKFISLFLAGLMPFLAGAQLGALSGTGTELLQGDPTGVKSSSQSISKSAENTDDLVEFKISVYLEGPFEDGKMITDLNKQDLLPLSQPYNIDPWNYDGDETVSGIPNGNVVDWVLVDLRQADSAGGAHSGTTIARRAGFLMSNGSIFDLDGSSLLTFDGVFT